MTDFFKTTEISAAGMRANAQRLRIVSENLANADTPGYRRKVINFEAARDTGLVQAGKVKLDQGDLPMVYDPGNPMADESGHYEGSNVELVTEIADAREAQRSYEANLNMFDQTRQMTRGLLDLLRK
jgi:flagellar basal-body rod protein FlgC